MKTHSIPWKNGELTRQIVLFNGGKPRVHLLDNRRGLLQELTEGELGQMCSLKSKNHYWEQLDLGYDNGELEREESFEDKKTRENERGIKYGLTKKDMIRRATYYLKFMDAEVIEDIMKVQKELLTERTKLVREHTHRKWNGDNWVENLHYVEFIKIFRPLETKAHKLIDKVLKDRAKAKEKQTEPDERKHEGNPTRDMCLDQNNIY